jgi:thioesterase domain-containing protein/acyl carrier protein
MTSTDPAGVRTEIQATLAEISGTEVILTDTLAPDDLAHWDSLMSVDLVVALQRKLGVKFTPAEIGTIQRRKEPFARLADWILAKQNGGGKPAAPVEFHPDFPVVPIQPEGAAPPFFCVHGAGGIVIPFYELARRMGEARPFYGIQDTVSDITDRAATVEALATRYVAAVRQVQPRGPYFIGGLCFGGLVAFEMARQLAQQGETVARLVMISTPRGDNRFEKFRWHEKITKGAKLAGQIWGETLLHLNEPVYLALASRRLRRRHAGLKVSRPAERLCAFFQRHSTLGRIVPPDSRVLLNRQFNVQQHGMMKLARHHLQLHRRYTGQPYSGRVTFLKAEHNIVSTGGYADDVQGWGPLFRGPVEIRVVRGCHHMNITREPHVAELAQFVDAALAGA